MSRMKVLMSLILLLLSINAFFPEKALGMHIAEGFLPFNWAGFWMLITIPFVAHGLRVIKKSVKDSPNLKMLLGLVGAYAFVLSALKLPSVSGSSSHPTGVGLGAILFGPPAMSVIGLIVLIFQAVFLAHGGLTTLGANTFSMAIVGPFVAYYTFRGLKKARIAEGASVFLATALGNFFTYVTTAFQLSLAFPSAQGGVMSSFIKFMGIFSLTQIPLAIVEGLITVMVFNIIYNYNKEELLELSVINRRFKRMKNGTKNGLIILVILAIIVIPLWLEKNSSFTGADTSAQKAITEINTNYKSWFGNVWKPPSSEVESFIFALQAAIGSGFVFYYIGYMRGKHRPNKEGEKDD